MTGVGGLGLMTKAQVPPTGKVGKVTLGLILEWQS